MLTDDKFLKLVKGALKTAYDKVKAEGGKAKCLSGKQKDITTRADLAAGQAIIDLLKKSDLPIVAYTEEFAKVNIKNNPRYSVVFDDMDGTLNFKDGYGTLPHGSIVGIFNSPDPKFSDCLVSGFLEFNGGNLFYAVKGRGTFLIRSWANGNNKKEKIITSGRKTLKGKSPLRLTPDIYSLGNIAKHFVEFSNKEWLGDFRCTAVQIALIAAGSFDIFVFGNNFYIPMKKKTSEELGPGYLLVKEAGGAVLDWNGNDIGNERVGLQDKKTFHIVVAATEELGREFVAEMHKIPEIVEYMKKKKLL